MIHQQGAGWWVKKYAEYARLSWATTGYRCWRSRRLDHEIWSRIPTPSSPPSLTPSMIVFKFSNMSDGSNNYVWREVDTCTDVVSVSIGVINKCTATHTMYITEGMNLLCHVHTIISLLYIPIHTHATPTCTWSPLNIILCSSLSSLFSPAVKLSCYMAPFHEGVGRASDVKVYVLISSLLLIITTVTVYSPTHIAWYIDTELQIISGHR